MGSPLVRYGIIICVFIVVCYAVYLLYVNEREMFSSDSITVTPGHKFKITKPVNVLQIYKLLYILDKILTKHGIEYWIDGGTLLGAIRHRGLIPWDDDGDIQIWDTGEDELVSLGQEFNDHGIILMNTWFGYKIFFKTGTPIK